MEAVPDALVAEGATDIASVALFDPAALDPAFDDRFRRGGDPTELVESECARGAAFVTDTGADGAFLLHVYLDREPPPEVGLALRDPIIVDPFLVPSGRLVFGGTETMHRTEDSFVRRHPSMATTLHVPPGTYRLVAYRTEFDRDSEAVLECALGEDERRVDRIRLFALPIAMVGVASALVGAFLRNLATAVGGLALAWLATSARTRAQRSPLADSVDEKRRAIAIARPSIVAVLAESVASEESDDSGESA